MKFPVTSPGTWPSIRQGASIPLEYVAKGATYAVASAQVIAVGKSGMMISGAGVGATVITTISSTELLSHPVGAV